ncbi:hypothetical protein ACFYUY_35940 [Kitasatospora sp. NPDC004745]
MDRGSGIHPVELPCQRMRQLGLTAPEVGPADFRRRAPALQPASSGD